MTLPPFDLHRPRSVEEASELMAHYEDDAVFYCGGTELLLILKLGFAAYGHLVDVKRIEELQTLEAEDGVLRIGAAVPHRAIERSPLVRERWPALAQMERGVANIRVRNAGTLGGNLCFSDPHSDPATFLLAAEAHMEAQRGGTARKIPIHDFVRGPYETALEDGELLVAVQLPELPRGAALAHGKFAFHERPAATVSCFARVLDGRVAEARVAVGSVGVVPVRASEAERILTGAASAGLDSLLEDAGAAAGEAAGAVADQNGSPDYKRNLVRVLVRRCFGQAIAHASSEQE